MKYLLCLSMLLVSSNSYAESVVPLDKVAHFGVSFAVNSMAYAGCKAAFEDSKGACLTGAVLGTVAMGVAKEVMDGNKNSNKQHAKDLAADLLGVGLSAASIVITW